MMHLAHGDVLADPLPSSDLSENVLRSLLIMARLTAAYTIEVASGSLMDDQVCHNALWKLENRGYIEYHPNDSQIDTHLSSFWQRAGRTGKRSRRMYPYWRIKRRGVSVALRLWGVPAGTWFGYRREGIRLPDRVHRRRSREWPMWVSKALPHADIHAGWSEVCIPDLRAYPDALAWGKLAGFESLFWLEVESGHCSRDVIFEKTRIRWLKAVGYAEAVGVRLVFVFFGMPWVRDAARLAFMDVPQTCAVIIADWSRHNFGQLLFPKWGEVVFE